MNMEYFQRVMGFSLLVSLFASAFSHPIEIHQQQYTDFAAQPVRWYPSSSAEKPYVRFYPDLHYVYESDDPTAKPAIVPVRPSGYPNTNYVYQQAYPVVSYPHPSIVPAVPFGQRPKPVVQNATNFPKVDDQRSLLETQLFDQIFARMIDELGVNRKGLSSSAQFRSSNDNDEPFEPSTVTSGTENMDPEFLSEIEATLYEITGGRRDKREKDVANHTVGSQLPYLENSAYIYHPAPMTLMQSIEQGQVAEPSSYQNNYAVPLPSYAAMGPGSQSGHQNNYAVPVPSYAAMGPGSQSESMVNAYDNATNPFMASQWQKQYPFNPAYPFRPAPVMQSGPQTYPADPMFYYNFPPLPSPMGAGLAPSAYSSQDQASYFLQPVYTNGVPVTPTLFQVWPTSGQQQKPASADSGESKLLGPNSSPEIPQDSSSTVAEKPNETNLTTVHLDPVHEKKSNHHLQTYTARKPRVVNEKRSSLPRSFQPVEKHPSFGYWPSPPVKENQPRRRHNKPFVPPVKQVLVPYHATGREASFPPIHEEETRPQRYRVYSQILKTYVPVSR